MENGCATLAAVSGGSITFERERRGVEAASRGRLNQDEEPKGYEDSGYKPIPEAVEHTRVDKAGDMSSAGDNALQRGNRGLFGGE